MHRVPANSVVIAGILTPWPVGETNQEETSTNGGQSEVCPSRAVERAHASMRSKKTPDSRPIDMPGNMINSASMYQEELDFGMLYEQFKRPLHSYIYRLLGSQEDADDITQEVFTRAYVAWNTLYDRENLSPWLYRIASNLCVDHLRKRKRISWWPLTRTRRGDESGDDHQEEMSYLLSDSGSAGGSGSLGGIPEVGEREHIHRTLASMPRDYAVALVLNAAQGVPYQEIGSILGISPNAAATRISRAKRMFMEIYQRFSNEGAGKQE